LIDVYTEVDLENSLHYKAHTFASCYIENKGKGKFELNQLPDEVQISCINGIVPFDYNKDGHLDVVVGGNMYGSEVETTRNDASYGSLLLGNGKGDFGISIIAANNSAQPTLLKLNAQ